MKNSVDPADAAHLNPVELRTAKTGVLAVLRATGLSGNFILMAAPQWDYNQISIKHGRIVN